MNRVVTAGPPGGAPTITWTRNTRFRPIPMLPGQTLDGVHFDLKSNNSQFRLPTPLVETQLKSQQYFWAALPLHTQSPLQRYDIFQHSSSRWPSNEADSKTRLRIMGIILIFKQMFLIPGRTFHLVHPVHRFHSSRKWNYCERPETRVSKHQ